MRLQAARKSAPAAPVAAPSLQPGAAVLAQWTDGKWYPATIVAEQAGQYQVDSKGNPYTAWLAADCVRPEL